jgi:hypothetical protein
VSHGGIHERYRNLRRGGGGGREARSAGRLAPLGFTDEQMRAAHAKLSRGEPAQLETRDFTTGVPLIPPELFPIPTFPRHEARLMDRLRGYQLDAPSLEFVQVTSVSGAAAVVGEGQSNPNWTCPPPRWSSPR